MKRNLPLAITFIMGVVMIIQFFVPHKISQDFYALLMTKWLIIIGAFFLVIGLSSLINVHYMKISRQVKGWGYSIIIFVGMIGMCLFGFIWGVENGTPFMLTYDWVFVPLDSTMFSLLAFYMASASFRAFRAKSVVAAILLLAAVIVMFGRVPIGETIWGNTIGALSDKIPSISNITEWIMEIPNMAQKRGILLGVVLGMLATSLRIIFGIERSYLGGKE